MNAGFSYPLSLTSFSEDQKRHPPTDVACRNRPEVSAFHAYGLSVEEFDSKTIAMHRGADALTRVLYKSGCRCDIRMRLTISGANTYLRSFR